MPGEHPHCWAQEPWMAADQWSEVPQFQSYLRILKGQCEVAAPLRVTLAGKPILIPYAGITLGVYEEDLSPPGICGPWGTLVGAPDPYEVVVGGFSEGVAPDTEFWTLSHYGQLPVHWLWDLVEVTDDDAFAIDNQLEEVIDRIEEVMLHCLRLEWESEVESVIQSFSPVRGYTASRARQRRDWLAVLEGSNNPCALSQQHFLSQQAWG